MVLNMVDLLCVILHIAHFAANQFDVHRWHMGAGVGGHRVHASSKEYAGSGTA